MNPITADDVSMLNDCLTLNAERGVLTWKKKIAKKAVVGAEAGSAHSDGYRVVQIFKRRMLVHRVIYAMVHGECIGEIDHINGNPSDNRPCNLRVVTRSQQNMNKKPSRTNKFGVPGVCFYPRFNLYNARVRVNGRRISLGYYKTLDEAYEVYKKAVEQYHGEYRRQA